MTRPAPAIAALAAAAGLAGSLVVIHAQSAASMSEAERRYVAPAATRKVADGPRTATLAPTYGRKFAAENTRPRVTVSNPYMDLSTAFFSRADALSCLADGSVMVGGQAGFDKDGRELGTGFWRIAPDGAVSPVQTRSTGAYPLTAATTCNAPFGKTVVSPRRSTVSGDGRLVVASMANILSIGADGRVTRLAGASRGCEDSSERATTGFVDGSADTARFLEPGRPVLDPDGNIWLADQKGCTLRRITPAGEVTTVLRPDVVCNESVPQEDRPMLHHLAWDAAAGELVAAGSNPVAKPVHNLYTTVFRVKPTGEFRRVFFATKVGRSPAKVGVDGVRAMAVDARGRIHLVSLLMLFERRGFDALQVLRVDEAANAVVPLTGTKIRNGTWLADHPYDGPAELAWFEGTRDMCIGPDGTMFVSDELLIRKIDPRGQVTTWAF